MQTDNVKIVTQKKGNKTVHTPSRDASLVVREAINASRRKISLLTSTILHYHTPQGAKRHRKSFSFIIYFFKKSKLNYTFW